MQSLIKIAAVTAFSLGPVLAFAQSNEPLTRAEVRAQVLQVEHAGYDPFANDFRYPENLQRAEAKIAQQQADTSTAYGPTSNGAVQSGK
ncbi:UNVERIFIED_ORG: uncharacterized protein DUF4148 [Burkholderia sp. CF145]|jgi:hypothetical protein